MSSLFVTSEAIKNFILALLIILIIHILLKGHIIEHMSSVKKERFYGDKIAPKFFEPVRAKSKKMEDAIETSFLHTDQNCKLDHNVNNNKKEETIINGNNSNNNSSKEKLFNENDNDMKDLYKFVFENEDMFTKLSDNTNVNFKESESSSIVKKDTSDNIKTNVELQDNSVLEINNHTPSDNILFNDVSGFDDNVMQTFYSSY